MGNSEVQLIKFSFCCSHCSHW